MVALSALLRRDGTTPFATGLCRRHKARPGGWMGGKEELGWWEDESWNTPSYLPMEDPSTDL